MPKNKSYSKTTVDPMKSISAIKQLLNQRGIFTIQNRDGYDPIDDKYKTMIGFSIVDKIDEKFHETPVGFIMTLDHKPKEGKKYHQELRSIYRVLFNHIKQIFVSIDYGLLDLKEAFMPNIMTRGPDGQITTMYKAWLPSYMKALVDGSFNDVSMLPSLPSSK